MNGTSGSIFPLQRCHEIWLSTCPPWRRKVAGDLDHSGLGLVPDRGEIPGGKKRVEVKAFLRLQEGSSLKPSPTPAYFPPFWSSRMEHSGRITPASQSSLCPPGLQLCHLGCSPGKTEDQLISKGATGPGAGARLTRTWAGRGQRAHSALCRGFKPGVERPSPIL